MDKLQAGIEPALAVLARPPVLLQPRKAALDHPAPGYHRKLVQLAVLGYLHRQLITQRLAHAQRKRLYRVPAVAQHALHSP